MVITVTKLSTPSEIEALISWITITKDTRRVDK